MVKLTATYASALESCMSAVGSKFGTQDTSYGLRLEISYILVEEITYMKNIYGGKKN